MRAVYFTYVVLLINIGLLLVIEADAAHVAAKGYPLIPREESMYVNGTINADTFNSTLENYGLDRIPSQAGTNYYLGTGGTLLTTYNAFKDVFLYTTLGLSDYIERAFPSALPGIVLGISVLLTLNNLLAAISLLRGMVIKWL